MGEAASFFPSTLSRPFAAPRRPPGACLIRSRPDLARGPGPGGKLPLPSLSCSRSGSQETPPLGVIYRNVQESFPSCFCSLPGQWIAGLTLCPCLSLWPSCSHDWGREGLGDLFLDCLGTKVLSSSFLHNCCQSRPLSTVLLSLTLTLGRASQPLPISPSYPPG